MRKKHLFQEWVWVMKSILMKRFELWMSVYMGWLQERKMEETQASVKRVICLCKRKMAGEGECSTMGDRVLRRREIYRWSSLEKSYYSQTGILTKQHNFLSHTKLMRCSIINALWRVVEAFKGEDTHLSLSHSRRGNHTTLYSMFSFFNRVVLCCANQSMKGK